MDELLVQVEATPCVYERDETALLRDRAAAELQSVLGLRTQGEGVAIDTFPRTDFTARRVVDDREVFRDLNQRLRG